MIAAIIAGLTFLGQLLGLGIEIWHSIKEKNDEIKKEKTKEAQSGIRGIIDGDASRVNAAINRLRRLRK